MQPQTDDSGGHSGIVLELLNSVERDSGQSQRGRASEFGVAVGLVNAYLKFCIKKGYVKVKCFPARRYSYLLTPKGFTEKSRLTLLHLSSSLAFFRQARTDCAAVFAEVHRRGWKRVVLMGVSEVAEISTLCALERDIAIVGIVDPGHAGDRYMGFALLSSLEPGSQNFDGVIVTSIVSASEAYADAAARCGEDRVLAPSLLCIRQAQPKAEAAQ